VAGLFVLFYILHPLNLFLFIRMPVNADSVPGALGEGGLS